MIDLSSLKQSLNKIPTQYVCTDMSGSECSILVKGRDLTKRVIKDHFKTKPLYRVWLKNTRERYTRYYQVLDLRNENPIIYRHLEKVYEDIWKTMNTQQELMKVAQLVKRTDKLFIKKCEKIEFLQKKYCSI